MKKYKKPRDELVCIPSGFVREDGTEIMAWTLKSLVKGTQEENYNYLTNEYEELKDLYSLKEQDVLMICEDSEEYIYNPQEQAKENNQNSKKGKNPQNDSTTNSKHDKLFKIILSNKQEAAKFMNKVLKINYKIMAEKLELYNKEYITTKFEKMESDIVYKIAEKNTYMIIEHQSIVDRSMPYRIFQYTAELLREVIEKDKVKNINYLQPRIIAIVLYTGNRKWNIQNIDDLQAPLEGYKKIKPPYILVDINKFSKRELLEDDLMITKAMLIEKEKSVEGILNSLKQIRKKILANPNKRQMQLFMTIVRYILLSIDDEETKTLLQAEIEEMKGVEEDMLHATMVLNEAFEKREKKGRMAGIKEIAKKLLKQNMKIETISEITGLTIEEIEKLK